MMNRSLTPLVQREINAHCARKRINYDTAVLKVGHHSNNIWSANDEEDDGWDPVLQLVDVYLLSTVTVHIQSELYEQIVAVALYVRLFVVNCVFRSTRTI